MGIIDALRARGVDVAHVSQIMWSLNKRSPCRDLTTGRMCGNGSLTSILKANGLYRHKHIPAIYMRASRTQRLDLFQGLMDTDGSVTPNGHCEFTNTNLTLANDFFDLAITLGLKPVFASGDATLNGRFISKKYRITFTPYFPVFKLDRKLARQNKTPTKRTLRFITGVTPVDSVPVRCIAVDSPSHLFLAGRTMIPTHNTKAGAEETWWRAAYFGQRCAVVAATTNDLWRVCFEGESGILNCVPPSVLVGGKIDIGYNKTHSEIHFQSGGVIQGFTAESPERLRGPQFHYAWCDELASWNNFDTWEQLMMTLRLGRRPQIVATTTPKPVPLVRELASPPSEKYPNGRAGVDTIVVSGSSYENEENLSKMFFKNVERKSGTRMSRQEIYAELLEDIDGALWTIKMIEDAHLKEPCPTRSFFKRIVVSVDPAMTNTNTSDSTGIVVVALGEDELGYILEDATMKASPNDWGKKVIELYHKWHADVIVAESTQGGDIVRGVILQHDRWANVKDVRERTGKWLRAEPIASLYEQKRIKHIKPFIALEDQMTHFTKDKVKYTDNDRVDALVYGFAELMQEEVIPPAKFIRRAFMRR
jgi:phage terminase large subunit-like protein